MAISFPSSRFVPPTNADRADDSSVYRQFPSRQAQRSLHTLNQCISAVSTSYIPA